ncbi:hypothetical protein P700755_002121 [Psychroflexus torquis ATCC 700755]|jgi:hypothetical protein|uniref:Uncharacterized protein n=1 Tax=Psychroflexus torquis (strain ATCC 700755 / CIP 106069 / ACAM 623) TaxID=313595 RepID=K4IEC3_PSYTT|nr:hypothetical protein [Psychroflexus torquis]AFU68912.1 hypothetical protein P700755_002121 [Psychroflexus torquis ATCC 700755]
MDLVFITNKGKLGIHGLKLDVKRLIQGLKLLDKEIPFCYKKEIGSHNIYILYDGQSNTLNRQNSDVIIPLLKEIVEKGDFYIVQHSNQSQDITAITDLIKENRSEKVFDGMHELGSNQARHYQNLPFYLTNETALNNWVAEIKGENKNASDLNQKLTLLYKLLGKPLLTINEFEGEEKELAKPYFELEYDKDNAKEDEKTARLRHLRDSLLIDLN